MSSDSGKCFQTMESALEYLQLLEESVADARQELEREVVSSKGVSRHRVEALRLALYQMGKLSTHLRQSQDILANLRRVRALMPLHVETKDKNGSNGIQALAAHFEEAEADDDAWSNHSKSQEAAVLLVSEGHWDDLL